MAKTTNKTNTETKVSSKKKQENLLEKNQESEQRIKELEQQIANLTELMQKVGMKSSYSFYPNEEVINPNKKTKVTSLTYGMLTLHCSNRGFLKFKNFGDFHTITYSQLTDYINSCRLSAEQGRFYIHDQKMVEDLGLGEAYEKLFNIKIVSQLVNNPNEIDYDSLRNTTQEQKFALAEIISNKIYSKEINDLNEIGLLSEALGVELMDKVKEMKETEEFVK